MRVQVPLRRRASNSLFMASRQAGCLAACEWQVGSTSSELVVARSALGSG
jgi:hypothetical protein